MLLGVALRALGGVWSACWGLVGVWAGAASGGGTAGGGLLSAWRLLPDL